MQLSIIIVNYNVRHFLEQALHSVYAAIEGIDAEVFVVDNNSVDGSVSMLRQNFHWIKLVALKENLGFSRANNVAIRQAQGKYILLLNPDTVVETDTFRKCLDFMEAHPKAGGLGLKMINGKGEFLPESKRALPTPWVAFYKIFGLARLFPKSKTLGRYHLTYLSPDETHEVEVLSGAFMMLRKETLDKIGLLDEAFFMYGEDIDLSYRIIKAGYKNYYFADTKIIHYKGESTKKGSLNYVLVFYNAMMIFARKHFSRGKLSVFMFLIRLAVYFRASLALAWRIYHSGLFPLIEFGFLLGGTLLIKDLWEEFGKHTHGGYYPPLFNWFVAPIYAAIFVLFLSSFGAYRRPYKIRTIVSAIFSGFITIATFSFIFKDINFSRAIVVLSSVYALFLTLFERGFLNFLHSGNFFLDEKARKRVLIAGDATEAHRVISLLQKHIYYNCEIIGVVSTENVSVAEFPHLGEIEQLDEIVRFYQAEEIIFCNQSIPTQAIIEQMSRLAPRGTHFKIVPPNADYLIGPNVILTSIAAQPIIANLQKYEYRFKKKVFDLAVSSLLLCLFPFTFWFYRLPMEALRNLWQVFCGDVHLVGYIESSRPGLPRLKQGLLDMRALFRRNNARKRFTVNEHQHLDTLYARNYNLALDWEILMSGLRHLGEKAT